MNIFLLEDDNSLRRGIELKLSKEGHNVICSDTFTSALKTIDKLFDMAILDINLPDGSGLDICIELRKKSVSPHILILTSNDVETDIVMGYEIRADDYMTKPFSLSVLLSKVNAVQRRIEHISENKSNTSPSFLFDHTKQNVKVRGQTISLTRNEWRLLNALWENRGLTLTKNQLLESLWDIDGEFVDENTLAVNIRRLREKIEENPSSPLIIENVRGIGYRLKQL